MVGEREREKVNKVLTQRRKVLSKKWDFKRYKYHLIETVLQSERKKERKKEKEQIERKKEQKIRKSI